MSILFFPFSLFLVNGIKFTRKVSGIKRICCPVLFGTAVRYKTVGVSGIIRILQLIEMECIALKNTVDKRFAEF
jgi:hypothetical protein